MCHTFSETESNTSPPASHASLDLIASRRIAVYSAEQLEPEATELTKRFEYTPSLGEKSKKNVQPGLYIIEWDIAKSSSEPARKARRLNESTSARCLLETESVKCRLAGPLTVKGNASSHLDDVILGQAVLMPDFGEDSAIKIIATGYPSLGNKARLGNIYCNNRPSDIYSVPFKRIPIHYDPMHLANWSSSAFSSDKKPERWEVPSRSIELLTGRTTTSQTSRPLPPKISWRKPFAAFGLHRDGVPALRTSAPDSWQERLYMLGTATGGPHNSCSFLRVQITRRKLDPEGRLTNAAAEKFDCTTDFDRTFFAGRDIHRPYQHVDGASATKLFLSRRDAFLLNGLSFGASKIEPESSSFVSVQANLTDDQLSLSVTHLRRAPKYPHDYYDAEDLDRVPPSDYHEEILCSRDTFGIIAILQSSSKLARTWLSVCKIDFQPATGPPFIEGPSLEFKVPQVTDFMATARTRLVGGDLLTNIAEDPELEGKFKRFYGTKYLRPKLESASDRPPTIIIPHGGPHGFSSAAFVPSHVALAMMGYQLYLPNYPGSIGGKDDSYVQELIGHCGDKDVQYCMDLVTLLCEQGIANPGQIYVMGGSHGGFIAAHLISQFPSAFRAAVMRNPVIDIATNVVQTDIPDW